MASYYDTIGDDTINGSDSADTIRAVMGGDDVIRAGGGDDRIEVGGALSNGDRIDGGDGTDFLELSGDYSHGLRLSGDMVRNIEFIQFWAGDDYSIAVSDEVVAAGEQLVVSSNGLNADDHLSFDGSSESDGYFSFSVGQAATTMIGGRGNDDFSAHSDMSTFDVLEGGWGGDDLLRLYGDPGKMFDFAGNHVHGFEHIILFNGASLALADDVVDDWQILRVDADLNWQMSVSFDGSAERGGAFLVTGADFSDHLQGGGGADTISGLGGDDRIVGHGGADELSGGDGADTFVYRQIKDSRSKTPDIIHDLGYGDVIDLSAIDAKSDKAGNQAFHLVAKLDGHAGEAALHYDPVSGRTQLSLDVDGDGKVDAMILIDGDHRDFADFVL